MGGSRNQCDVMVIEDDPAIRDSVCELLQDQGYAVAAASNGSEALDALRAGAVSPDVILLDLMMPVMDGWSFREAQRREPPLAAIPVVVVSADHGLEQKIRHLQADACLAKPFDLDALVAMVQRFCRRAPRAA